MNKFEQIGAANAKAWNKPELKRLNAGSAENGPTGLGNDSGAGQDPRNTGAS